MVEMVKPTTAWADEMRAELAAIKDRVRENMEEEMRNKGQRQMEIIIERVEEIVGYLHGRMVEAQEGKRSRRCRRNGVR